MKSEASVCAVVGVGASAGGLEALKRLCAALPSDAPFALVIVQHLDPSRPSHLADILAEACALKVVRIEDGQAVAPGVAFVVPEGVEVRLMDGRLRLSPRPADCHDPIDAFFLSLAGHSGAHGCGILLSGEGSDGAHGLREIRGAGGITLVQDPTTAEHSAMPDSAIGSGAADFVGSPEDIAAELLLAVRHPRFGSPTARSKAARERDDLALARVLSIVRKVTGMDFSAYKPTTVMRRVSRRTLLRDVDGLEAYVELLEDDPRETEALVDDMLINVTEFFRDPEVFEALKTRVIPKVLAEKPDGDTVRIWVAGCSTGEEVYSVLITALEAIEAAGVHCNVTVFGTDASEHAVRRARAGQYPVGVCAGLSPERLARYFVPTSEGYEVSRTLRDMCVFARQDITKDTPFSRLDIITLRNVLIYMNQPLQKKVLEVAHFALSPEGFLVLGTSETPEGESRLFKTYDKAHHVYRRKDVAPRLPFDVANALPVDVDSFAVPVVPFGLSQEQSDVRAEATEMTLLLYAPPRVVVDGEGHVVHFFGDTSPYLEHPEGRATFELLEMALPGLALEVKEALDESVASGGSVAREATFGSDGQKRRVSVEVTPLQTPNGTERRLVAFRELPFESGPFGTAASGDDLSRLYESREDRLRTELSALRTRIRAISEEKDRANQGLRVANEEARSSNEELRSINEELETAKEELQSANEELITVNDELRQSNRDLAVVNTDIENFMESTGIPVLMLDRDLKVRRFTPHASRVVHIAASDQGRPLSHLRFRVEVPELEELAREVLETHSEASREVRDHAGHWYSMQVHPYVSGDGVVDGVVVAFLDVDELRQSVERIRRRSELNRALNEIDVDIASTTESDEILRRALDAAVRALGVDAGSIAMLDADGWVVGAQVGSPTADVGMRLSPDDARIAIRVGDLRELIVVEDVTTHADVNAEFAAKRGVKSIMAVPLIAREEVIGSLLLFTRAAAKAFTTSERDFASRLGASVSLAIDNARLIEAERDAARRAVTLNAINVIIQSTLTTEDLLERLADEVSAVAGADRSMVVEARGESYVVTHARNVRKGVLGHTGVPEDYPAFAEAARTQCPVLIEDTWEDPRTNKDFVVPYELRAFQLLPLVVGDRTEAVLALAWGAPQSFDAEDQASAERFAVAMSVALSNAKLYESERRAKEAEAERAGQLESIHEIATIRGSTLSTIELCQRVVDNVGERFGLSQASIYLAARERDALVPAAAYGIPVDEMPTIRLDSDFPTAHAFNEGTPRFAGDASTANSKSVESTRKKLQSISGRKLKAYCVVPLQGYNATLGTLTLTWPTSREFDAQDVDFLTSIGHEIAIGLENARLFEAEVEAQHKANQELEFTQLLLDSSAALAEWTEVGPMLEHLADVLVKSSAHSRVTIGLWDEERRELTVVASKGEHVITGVTQRLDEMSGPARRMIRSKRPVLIDYTKVKDEALRKVAAKRKLRFALVVPIVARGRLLGSITVDAPGEHMAFSERETALIESVAGQAATAIENGRLFEAEVEAQQSARSALEVTSQLLDSSAALAGWTELSGVLDQLARSVHVATGRQRVFVHRWDEERPALVLAAAAGSGSAPLGSRYEWDQIAAPSKRVLTEKRAMILDYDKIRSAEKKPYAGPMGFRVALAVPLCDRSTLVGLLIVDDPGERHEFEPLEIELVQGIAAQASAAIRTARSFEAEQAELVRTTVLKEVATAAVSTLDQRELARRVLEACSTLLGAKAGSVYVIDDEARMLRAAALFGFPEQLIPQMERMDLDAERAAARSYLRDEIVTHDSPRLPGGIAKRAKAVDATENRWISLPIRARGEVLGSLGLIFDEKRAFTGDEIALYESLAAQLGTGVDKARLFSAEVEARQEAKRELDATDAILSASASIAGSIRLEDVLSALADAAGRMTGRHGVTIDLVDEDRRTFTVAFATRPDGAVGLELPFDAVPPGILRCIEGKQPVVIDYDDSELPDRFKGNARQYDIHSMLCVPLVLGNRVVGGMFVHEPGERRPFSEREVGILSGLAPQAAMAIRNAQLFEAEQLRRRRIDVLREVSTLAISSLEPGEAADAALEFLGKRLDVAAASLWTVDSTGERLFPIGGFGFPNEFFEDFAEGVAIDAPFVVAQAFVQGRPVAHANGHGEAVPARVREAYARHGVALESLLVLPLVGRASVFGAVTLSWGAPHVLDEAEVDYWSAIVNTLAAGLEITRLYEATLRSARLDEALNRIDARIHSTLDFDEIMQGALDQGVVALACDAGTIETREGTAWRVRFQNGFSASEAGRLLSEAEAPNATRAMLLAEPIVITDMGSDEVANVGFVAEHGLRSALAIPLIVKDEVTGCLLFYNRQATRAFDDMSVDFGRKLGASVSLALENCELVGSLESTRSRVTSIVESISDGFYALDRDWRFTYANTEAGRMMGVPAEAIIGKTIAEALSDPDRLEFQKRTFGPAMYDGQPVTLERLFPQTGIWTEMHVYPSADGVVVYGRDITDRKRAEDALRESEARYRIQFETMSEGFVLGETILDDKGVPCDFRYLELNPAFEQQTGLDAAQVRGKTLLELFPGAESVWIERYGQVAITGTPDHFQDQFGPLGKWFEVSVYQTEPGRFAVVFFDITERQAAEAALSESNERLTDVLDAMTDGFVSVDREWRYTLVNPKAEEMLHMPVEEVLGKSMEELFPDMFGWPHYRTVMESRVPETFEVWSKPLQIWLEVHAYPTEEGISILFADVTQRRAAADAVKQQNSILGAINNVLSLALHCDTEEELATACLAEAERLTGSAFGFIVEIDDSGVLSDLALSDPGWSACEAIDKSGHRRPPSDFVVHGLYGRVVLDGKAFYTNDPGGHPDCIGTPVGHPVLESFIGVPLMSSQRVFGVMALANREGGYSDADLAALDAFAPAVVESLMRKRAEETLAMSRERADMLATLLEQAAQPFGVGRPDGELLLVNEAFEDLTGYSAAELREVSWASQLTPPEYAEEEAKQLADAACTERPVRYEKEYVRKDGVRIPVELLVNVQKTDDGEVDYYYSFVTDLSDRKQRERLDTGLNRIGAAISSTLDRSEVLSRLHEGVCDTIYSDACAVATLEAGHWVLRHVRGASAEQLEAILNAGRVADLALDDEDRFGPIVFDDVREAESVAALASLGVRRLLVMPLLAGGRVVGAVATAQIDSDVRFSAAQIDFAARLMPLATLALENAELYERERTIADTLQEAILVAPARIKGIESAFLYRPASAVANVGGDFYDVFELSRGKVGIVTGDVSGKGLDAARLTSTLHDGVRAYAYEIEDPGEVLTRLNRLVHRTSPPEAYATVFFGVLDTDSGKLRYCAAGHPAPAVVGSEGATYLAPSRSPIVGAFDGIAFFSAESIMLPGETLVLFTDGITEARNAKGQLFGDKRLLAALGKLRRTPIDRLPQAVVDAVLKYSNGHLRDDTVVLAVRRTAGDTEPAGQE